jgi:hypothetical protein
METKNIAILLDTDNTQLEYLPHIIEEVKQYGNPIIKWAFGNWTNSQFSSWNVPLSNLTFRLIQSPTHVKAKNTTDISLVISAMELLYTQPHITGFCIVSSDSDFMQLAMKLIESNKFVMGIGRKQTPTPFVNACHVFKYIDDFAYLIPEQSSVIEEPQKTAIEPPKVELPKATPAKPTKTDTKIALLRQAVTNMLESNGSAQLGKVAQEIKRLSPSFKPSNYGFSNYVKLFEALPSEFSIELRDRTNHYIKIKK